MTDDLVAFLRDRLAEDEQEARTTAAEYGAVWTVDERFESVSSDTGADVVAEPGTPLQHIARHDPARDLAEVEAKRRILDEHTVSETSEFEGKTDTITYCPICRNDGECPTLRLLALPYTDHPAYRPEWRP